MYIQSVVTENRGYTEKHCLGKHIPEESVESSEAFLWVSVISKPAHCVPFLFSVLTFILLCINSTIVTRPAQIKVVASNETSSH